MIDAQLLSNPVIWYYNTFLHLIAMFSYLKSWKDEFLIWNPEDFDGIRHLTVSPDTLWVPDVYFFNGWVYAIHLIYNISQSAILVRPHEE